MAKSLNSENYTRLILNECAAIGDSWESPLENAKTPIPVQAGARMLSVPVPAASSTSIPTLEMALPLDIGDLLTGDVTRLKVAHSFIHQYDFLKFNEDHLHVELFKNVQYLALDLTVLYRDPFLGTMTFSSILEDDDMANYGQRRALLENTMEAIKELRENTFIELLSTIDYAYKEYGNGPTN